ncbi:MAG: PQQ-like beta-propeller repeat protein [Cytophagales bacterium]|nr:PQQ-like beta-propeller repeat protein [Armatimonadota bacterium]
MIDFPRRARLRGRQARGGAERGVLTAAAVLFLLGATATNGVHAEDWPVYRGDAQHSGVATEVVQPPLSLLWRFTGAPQPGNTSSATVVGETAYFTTRSLSDGTGNPGSGGVLYAVDVKTGALRWRTPQLLNNNIFSTTPLVEKERVYIGGSDSILYVYDAKDGREVVRFNAARSINSSPVMVNDVLYFGANDGSLRALDPQTGNPVWKQDFKAGDGINSSPIVAGSLIFFTTNNNGVVAVNAATGIGKWSTRLQYRFGPNAAIYADNTLYIPSGPRLHAIQQTSGNLRWARDFTGDLPFAPVAAEGIVYVVDRNKMMYAVRSNNGKDAWEKPVELPYVPAAAPTLSGDIIYIPTTQSVLLAVSRTDGKLLWQYRVDPSTGSANNAPPRSTVLGSPVSVANKALYLVSDDGSLSAFRPDAPDTSAPLTSGMYPPPGYAINGSPGLVIAANVTDPGSGIDPASVKMTLDSKEIEADYDTLSNLVFYKTRATGKVIDPPLANGRHNVALTAKDYKGNIQQQDWSFVVDNSLPQYRAGTGTATTPPPPQSRPGFTPNRAGGGQAGQGGQGGQGRGNGGGQGRGNRPRVPRTNRGGGAGL